MAKTKPAADMGESGNEEMHPEVKKAAKEAHTMAGD